MGERADDLASKLNRVVQLTGKCSDIFVLVVFPWLIMLWLLNRFL